MIGKTFGRYKITAELGKGGMGEVFLALDTVLERQVGLKFLAPALQSNPGVQRRFLREARTAAALDHPYICKIYEIGEDQGQTFIAMEYVEGQTVEEIVHSGAFRLKEALHFAAEIAEAMEAAHRRGIVHRDLKPSNLMVTSQGHVKVMDFGLAKQIASSMSDAMTTEGTAAGTMAYMSPEQARGQEVDVRSDIFSLGLVFYFIFTANHPFRRSSLIETVHAAMNEPPAPLTRYLSQAPPILQSMIEKMLAKEPGDRYSSIGEPLKILKELLTDLRLIPEIMDADVTGFRAPVEVGRTDSERRLLTAIFCEFANFSTLSETLDPEELHEVTAAFREICAGPIQRLQGRVVEARDNGVLAYFGYPAAHEDDARRAVRAGLEVLQVVASDTRLNHVGVQARVGIDSGLVVVSGAGDNPSFVGKPSHVAGLLPLGMPTDCVTVSLTTRQLVETHFLCEDAGLVTLQGYKNPINIYRVRSGGNSQGHVRPLIGRTQELGLLLERWERAEGGSGQAVLLTGEAGIGKSRLLEALKERLSGTTHARMELRCSPYYSGSAMYPVIESFERVLQMAEDDSPQVRWERLEKYYQSNGLPFDASAPLIGALLSLPPSAKYVLPNLTPESQKRKTQEVLLDLALQIADKRPLFFIVEDLHWIDPSTLELLNLLLDQLPTSRIFVLATSRPAASAPLSPRSYLTPVSLSALSRREAESLVDSVTGGKHLPADVLQMVVAKTDGVPLFVEEFTKMVIESVLKDTGDGYELTRSLPSDVPNTLQQSLMARLDRLAEAKVVAQMAATIGRTFSYDLLAAVSGLGEHELQRRLDRLVDAELLFRRGVPPRCTYIFKHGLIQDAAYQSLLKSARRQHHDRIAKALEERFPEMAANAPEILAHHHTEAGNVAPAISYWIAAGQRAMQKSADIEAIDKATRGLALVKDLPAGPERTQQELLLQTTLGPGLIATRGYAAPEVEVVYRRARELCRELGDPPQVFPVLFGLWTYYLVRSELASARELATQLSERAASANNPDMIMQADMALGWTCYFSGEQLAAREHLERGIAGYDPVRHQKHSYIYGQEPGMAGKACLSCVLWLLGYPEEAAKNSEESLIIAEQSHHHNSVAFALSVAGWLHQHRRDLVLAKTVAEKDIALTREQSIPFFNAMGTITLGWTISQTGESAQGMAMMRAGLAGLGATGAWSHHNYFTALLADVCGAQGMPEEALQLLDSTLPRMAASGERCWEVEIHRLRGIQMKTATPPDLSGAEAAFRQAWEMSRQRQERSLELRAATDLAQLLKADARTDEARTILAEVLDWFKTRKLETADTRAAAMVFESVANTRV